MAVRRMFSKIITNSSNFLMMSPSAQNLYFHLGMNADDDGFCEHFTVMRMTDSKPDDLRALAERGFVFVFDQRVLIIKDWKENNYIQADRYTPSKYLDIYKDTLTAINLPLDVSCIQPVYKADTQDRLGKDRLGKDINTERGKTVLTPYGKKESINQETIMELANKYQVPIEFVDDCWDSAQNWLLAKGKLQKDYKSFLANWVKREKANYTLKAKQYGNRYGVADFTNL